MFINNCRGKLDPNLINIAKDKIGFYRITFDYVDKNFDRILGCERYKLDGILFHKYHILFLLNYLDWHEVDVSNLKKEYELVNDKFRDFEKNHADVQKKINDFFYESLIFRINSRQPYFICKIVDYNVGQWHIKELFDDRDLIGFYLIELKDNYDLTIIKDKLSIVDKFLNCLLSKRIKKFKQKCPNLTLEYFPESFWWRRL